MNRRTGRSAWRRGLASIMLAGLAWSFVAPVLPAGPDEMHRCLPPAGAGAAELLSGFHEHCGHLNLGTCEAALACASSPVVALMGHSGAFAAPAVLSPAVMLRVPSAADLFRGGPPTPPPNS